VVLLVLWLLALVAFAFTQDLARDLLRLCELARLQLLDTLLGFQGFLLKQGKIAVDLVEAHSVVREELEHCWFVS